MRFAISIPQFVSDGEFDPARFRAYMARGRVARLRERLAYGRNAKAPAMSADHMEAWLPHRLRSPG